MHFWVGVESLPLRVQIFVPGWTLSAFEQGMSDLCHVLVLTLMLLWHCCWATDVDLSPACSA